ncbi:uncharacterized protein LOC116347162 [Contarinia nasturtii]|uniref:uncharacterized protein LOC116347162 n=1 Tax=Contarinia nasturtii TaxID=265458 RepID=UPI0012D4B3A0|nr:uncharacterized protein LOC116347162 [Contarinia nasturtii]
MKALVSLSLIALASSAYPMSKTNGMVGFAKAGGTTGGSRGSVVQINTLTDLYKNIGGSAPKVLVINKDIKAPKITKVYMGSNKSIIGSFGQRTLFNIHLRASPSTQNVIFQNLIFKHSAQFQGNDDIQLYLNFGKNYWIDHCTFDGHPYSDKSVPLDKLIYIGDKADYATISNCFFANHHYGLLLGHPADDNNKQFNGFPHLTICHNRFENLKSRAPGLMRYGFFHVYNNYINHFQNGFSVAQNAQVYSESNYFGAALTVSKHVLTDYSNGTCTFADPTLAASLLSVKSQKSKWFPRMYYSYKATSDKEAVNFTTKNAGSQSKALVFGS